MSKRPVTGGIRVKSYDVMARAVEEAVAAGLHRAQKHWDTRLTDEQTAAIEEHVTREVRSGMCDWFDFGGEQ